MAQCRQVDKEKEPPQTSRRLLQVALDKSEKTLIEKTTNKIEEYSRTTTKKVE